MQWPSALTLKVVPHPETSVHDPSSDQWFDVQVKDFLFLVSFRA